MRGIGAGIVGLLLTVPGLALADDVEVEGNPIFLDVDDCLPPGGTTFSPQYKICITYTGSCTVVEHTQVTSHGTGWFLRLFWKYDKSTVKVTTQIDCEGEVTVTGVHWGGIGIRSATERMVVAGTYGGGSVFASGADGVLLSADDASTCDYVANAPLDLGWCTTEVGGPWETHVTIPGRPSSLELCGKVAIINELGPVPVNGLLSTSGYATYCFDALKLAVASPSLDGLVLGGDAFTGKIAIDGTPAVA